MRLKPRPEPLRGEPNALWPIAVHLALVGLMAVAVCLGAAALLWFLSGNPPIVADRPEVNGKRKSLQLSEQLDLAKISLSVVAGVGGLVALVVAYRRQRDSEQSNRDTRKDATERRVTELYAKAAEQLGSDKAAVRLAGMHALERLAQTNEAHRQTAVNVICAYLRMPYDPASTPGISKRRRQPRRILRVEQAREPDESRRRDREELEVRLTAQKILQDHLYCPLPQRYSTMQPPDEFWNGVTLDLSEATLIEFDLSDCQIGTSIFVRTNFVGGATFIRTIFTHAVAFDGSIFTGDARFGGASFQGFAAFRVTHFKECALFNVASFVSALRFDSAVFQGDAGFIAASFEGETWFEHAQFHGSAWFGSSRFNGHSSFAYCDFMSVARFLSSRFAGGAAFVGSRFGNAMFAEAKFTGKGSFAKAVFSQEADFERTSFEGAVDFKSALFEKGVNLGKVRFGEIVSFEGSKFGGVAWFQGATFNRSGSFAGAEFSDWAWFAETRFALAAWFFATQFHSYASFERARFLRSAVFQSCDFASDAFFSSASFSGELILSRSAFGGNAYFDDATLHHDIELEGTSFEGSTFGLATEGSGEVAE